MEQNKENTREELSLLIKQYENNENILMGDILKKQLDIYSIKKGAVFTEADCVFLEIVLPTSNDGEEAKNVMFLLTENLRELNSLIASEDIIRMNHKDIKSFGSEIIMPDMVDNQYSGKKHHLTGHAFHMSLNDWENLSCHYKINASI